MGREEENEAQPESITVLCASPWGGGWGEASEGEEQQKEASMRQRGDRSQSPVSPNLLSQPDSVSLLEKWAPLPPEPSCCGAVWCEKALCGVVTEEACRLVT